jgi:hypothetical protein
MLVSIFLQLKWTRVFKGINRIIADEVSKMLIFKYILVNDNCLDSQVSVKTFDFDSKDNQKSGSILFTRIYYIFSNIFCLSIDCYDINSYNLYRYTKQSIMSLMVEKPTSPEETIINQIILIQFAQAYNINMSY